ncbi:VOC family protein [Radiobacillus sp. PE A8.2]|uniref:VOC family protein n=1 Tax=Radiobacillus sp. PE A8.2 TaxID=3380349 RepID=UPI00388E58DE
MAKLFDRIDTVFVQVHDLEKAVNWYVDTFELTVRFKIDNQIAALNVAETPLTLIQTDEVTTTQVKHPLFNFYTADIHKAHQKLQTTTNVIRSIEQDGEVTFFEFEDLDGNTLGVCSF